MKNKTPSKPPLPEIKGNPKGGNCDLSKVDITELFRKSEKPPVIEDPIFSVRGHVIFVFPLDHFRDDLDNKEDDGSTVLSENLIAFYGVCSGITTAPLSFINSEKGVMPIGTLDNRADVLCKIEDCRVIQNTNQYDSLLEVSKWMVTKGQVACRSSHSVAHFLPLGELKEGVQNEIKDKIRYYMKLSHELEYVIVTCFVLGTYLFPLFSYFGYLIITGEKGAGKGTCLDLLYKLCWNPTKKYISSTESTIFRIIKDQKPTLLIDEYHRAVKNKISGNAIISILESGYEKGGVVPRSVPQPDGTYKVEEFPVYCPKALVTRSPVEADDKGIKITVPKLTGDVTYAKRKIELEKDSFFEDIRIKILKWTPYHEKRILNRYDEIEPSTLLGGRDFQVWAPILAIASVAFPEVYGELFSFAESSVINKRSDNEEKETRVLKALHYLYKENNLQDGGKRVPKTDSYKVTNSDIKDALTDVEEDEDKNMHHKTIKSALDNLKIVGARESGTYYLKKHKLEKLFVERGFTKPFEGKSDQKYLTISNKGIPYESLDGVENAILAELASPRKYTCLNLVESVEKNSQFQIEEIKGVLNGLMDKGFVIYE
jgi:hypothetical protein